MIRRFPFIVLLLGATLSLGSAQSIRRSESGTPPPFLDTATPWADSVFSTLDLDQRIAQLMMVAAYSDRDAKHEQGIEDLIRQRNIGGIIFFKGGPARQAKLTNRFQAAAKTPLMIGMDLEWGLAMRLDSTIRFPRQMTLGALQNDSLIEEMGLEIAREIMRQPALKPFIQREVLPGDGLADREALFDYACRMAKTDHHPVGTCRMGHDAMAVVTPDLKVRGLDGLRVCDSAIMPTVNSSNTNAPTIMIGEKASDMIAGKPPLPPAVFEWERNTSPDYAEA